MTRVHFEWTVRRAETPWPDGRERKGRLHTRRSRGEEEGTVGRLTGGPGERVEKGQATYL
jgi:hypothetical protein